MLWPDVLVALGTGGLGVFVLPMLWGKAVYVPRLTSAAFTVFIICIAAGLAASDLLLGAAINAADAALWAAVFVIRGTPAKGE